jgi:hypothetical protein
MLVLRGPAGIENLVYVAPGGDVPLSDSGGTPLCNGMVFCDSPPNPVATRFPFFDFVGPGAAVFFDASGPAVYSVDLATKTRTLLSSAIAWKDLATNRPGWVDAYARDGLVTYWSLAVADGYRLYRSDGPGQPLQAIAFQPWVAGEQPRASFLSLTSSALAWSVGTIRGQGPTLAFVTNQYLMDRGGALIAGPSVLPSGANACDALPFLAGSTFAYDYFPSGGNCGNPRTMIVNVQTGAGHELVGAAGMHVSGLGPDGSVVYENMTVGVASTVTPFGVATGTTMPTISGALSAVSPDGQRLLLKNPAVSDTSDNIGVTGAVRVEDLADTQQSFTAVGGQGVGLGDTPYGEPHDLGFLPGDQFYAVAGMRSPDMCTNIGLRIYGQAARVDVEPSACSPSLVRQPKVSPDGEWLAYIDDQQGSFDIAAYRLCDGERVRMTTPTEQERGFVWAPQQ